jgi:hypothetical protein
MPRICGGDKRREEVMRLMLGEENVGWSGASGRCVCVCV